MKIFIPKENFPGEKRIALIPETALKLLRMGAQVEIESELGAPIEVTNEDYSKNGTSISKDRNGSVANADLVLRVRKPPRDEIKIMKPGAVHISFLDPFHERDLIQDFVSAKASAISMELIPRTTLAQKMDALSSQASLSGYAAVILAAERLHKIFPMMMTPAGTIQPAKVFVIGAGVAGLQAIATAKRLGARVEAFDTRSVVEEQVKSLGARFIKIDLGETGQTKDGYAKALTPEQIQRQRDVMAKYCAQSDVVITTAQVFGKKAPIIITAEMIRQMKPGSIVVDTAIESGGNVEGSKPDEEILIEGVRIIGLLNLPNRVCVHASAMYSNNLVNLIEHFWDNSSKILKVDPEDEIMKECLVTHEGRIIHTPIKNLFNLRG